MSERLAESPQKPTADDGGSLHRDGIEDAGADRDRMLLQHRWAGMELLVFREDIRRPTEWAIDQARHTLIVHLGGSMRRLEARIEGNGGIHGPPAPGDIWLVPSQHSYVSLAQGHTITYAELRISEDAQVELPDDRRTTLPELRPCMGHRDEFLYQAVNRLTRLTASDEDLSLMMAGQLQRGLRQHLFRDYRPGTGDIGLTLRRGPTLAPVTARRLSGYVQDNLDQRITLEELADVAGVGIHHLLIAFRKVFGTTPAQYILAQRLRSARAQLLNTNEDIALIAAACGFSSHGHLSTAFKRQTGITPSQFRKGLRTQAQL